jgi:small subunit ribosomal protein S5
MVLVEKYESLKSNFIEKLVNVRRTVKVVKGGRLFSFSALVVVGNGNGSVGFGLGKSRDVPLAIQKATSLAQKNFFFIELCNGTLYYPITYKHCATKIIMLPAYEGTGLIAGAGSKAVFEAVGLRNVISKCIGSHTAHNVVLATINALKCLNSPDFFFIKRDKDKKNIYFKC